MVQGTFLLTEPFLFFDEISVFLRGLVLGVVIAAPVGPVGLLCMKRTLQKGLLTGFATGFGAAFADAFFGAIAAFGVTAAVAWLTGYEKEIRLFGGLLILFMAVHGLMRTITITRNGEESVGGMLRGFVSGFFITLTNPLTILGVLAVVATFAGHLSYWQAATLTGGIFCGSALWWFMLSGGVFLIRHHFSAAALNWVNRITCILLLILGSWALFSGVLSF